MLKFLLDSLEGLEENEAKLYKKNADGKYQLQVDGLPEQEDVSGLKSALQKERQSVANLEGDLKVWQGLGETPESVIETIDELKKARGNPSDSDKLIEQMKAKHKTELETISSERDSALKSEHKAVVTAGFTSALAKAGFTDTGIDMIPKLHSSRVKMVERDGTRTPEIMTADGSAPLVGSGENSRATFDDLAKEFSIQYPDLVRSERKGGGGTPPGGGGSGTDKQMSRSDWNTLSPHEQQKTMADGVQLVD